MIQARPFPMLAPIALLLAAILGNAADTQPDTIRVWTPASEPEASIATDSSFVREQRPPGILQLLMRQDGATTVTVQIRREDRPTGGQRFRLRPDGWQRISLPLGLFGVKPEARQGFILSAAETTATIRIARADAADWPEGPGMSDGQLLDRIDLDLPDLLTVRERRTAGDETGAMRELVRYFRTRTAGRWNLPPAAPAGTPAANAVLGGKRVVEGRFAMLANEHTYADGRIDWHLDPTAGKERQTNEWIWSINRHEIATTLLSAWQSNADPAYPRAWSQALGSWLVAMPVPAVDWQTPGSGWRYIEAGLRMGEFWPNAWTGFRASPEVSDEVLIAMVKSFWEHLEFLQRHDTGMNNHFLIGQTGLYVGAALFPEFRESAGWRTTAARIIQEFVRSKTDEDAGWYERSPSYHRWLVQKLSLVFNVARLNDRSGDFPDEFRSLALRMTAWGIRLSAPDRIVPALNDSFRDGLDVLTAASIRDEFPASTVLPWAAALAAGSPPGQAPLPASELLAGSGYAVMRTSWAGDASYLLFDVGPMGGGHGHLDALNLIYAPDGRMTIFDTPAMPYNSSPFRTWAKSTAAHNAVLVDGRNQHRPRETAQDPVGLLPEGTPKPVFVATDAGIYACGWHVGGFGKDGGLQVRHRREICFSTTLGLAVVIDTLTPADEANHSYDLRWQIDTTTWKSEAGNRIILPEHAGRTLMALVPLAGEVEVRADSAATKPEILGWDVGRRLPGEGTQPPVPALTVRHLRSTARESVFVTALLPGSMLNGSVPQVEAIDGGWRVRCDDRQPHLVIAVGSSCRISGGGLPTDLVLERTTVR